MRHLINIVALLAGILAALAVCGCCSSSGNRSGAGVSVDLPGLPPLCEVFSGPPKPVCIPEGACVAAYGDEWKILGPCTKDDASTQAQYMMVPMRVDTFNRMMLGAAVLKQNQAGVDPVEAQDGEVVISRKVTTTYGEPAPLPEPDDE